MREYAAIARCVYCLINPPFCCSVNFDPQHFDFSFVRLAELKECIVGAAVKRIRVNQRLQPSDRRGPALTHEIKVPDQVFPLGEYLLHLEQTLLGFGTSLLSGYCRMSWRYSSSARLACV